MARIELKTSIRWNVELEALYLAVFAPRGEILSFLPDRFDVDGDLTSGTLTMIACQGGRRKVTYYGDGDHKGDLIGFMPVGRWAGFDVEEPMMLQEIGATAEPGLITLDAVSPDTWIPARYSRDVRVARTAEILRDAGVEAAIRMMGSKDRDQLDRLRRGLARRFDVRPHVAMIAARMSEEVRA